LVAQVGLFLHEQQMSALSGSCPISRKPPLADESIEPFVSPLLLRT
jgi:hypothetical protein